MKKVCFIILAIFMIVCFASCGTYTPPTGSGRPSGSGDGGGGGNTGGDEPPVQEVSVFTVTLVNAPNTLPEDMQAIWTKNNEVHTAKFIDNVATVEGLDGDYHVTLSTVPDGYTYDCNGYVADNDDKNIKIELLKLLSYKEFIKLEPNNEKGTLTWYKISKYGTYRVTLKSASDAVAFMFEPTENGRFSITSWCDVTANEINPILKIYYGTQHYCQFIEEIDDGGTSGIFTKNFRYTADFADENLNGVQPFSVKAAINKIEYPVTVDFTIKRESDYQLPDISGEPRYATGPYCTDHETGSWRYIYEDNFSVKDGKTYYIQDEDKVVYNKNDGFYHVGTVDGPLLYAKLTKDCQIFITATIPGGAWVDQGFSWNELANGMVNLSVDGYNYSYMINNGYARYCDSNGAHPVTEEIRVFLQGYASRENYFKDGEGWAEDYTLNRNDFNNPSGLRLQSDENSIWLFACGYYR